VAAIQAGLIVPSVIGMLASTIGLVYYLRLVKVMFFDEPAEAFDPVAGMGSKAILVISSVVALFFIVAASPVITAADAAAKALLP
jgi:NADH-quinone oxidoreductase subunit N